METKLNVKPAKTQGHDEITIEASIERVWSLIDDSRALLEWGPPVRDVTVLDQPGQPERLGSRRLVVAEMTPGGAALTRDEASRAPKKQVAHFGERRIEHVPGRRLAYRIEEEDIGIFRAITEVGYSQELIPLGPARTKVIWTFHHNPKGIMGHVLNRLLILGQQRKNRLAALAALKRYAEAGANTVDSSE